MARGSYYEAGAGRAAGVQALFSRVADRYDRINDLQSFGLHRMWKARLVREAGVRPGERALDVCCGTGDVAFALRSAGAVTAGVDFNLPMLGVARVRAERGGRAGAWWVAGDALRLPWRDAVFDLATISYGLRNLSDFGLGLREIRRVVRPGGRLLILDFGKPEGRVWRGVYLWYLRYALPVLGRVCCGDAAAYRYILESLEHYPGQAGVTRLLEASGWTRVRAHPLLGGVMGLHVGQRG